MRFLNLMTTDGVCDETESKMEVNFFLICWIRKRWSAALRHKSTLKWILSNQTFPHDQSVMSFAAKASQAALGSRALRNGTWVSDAGCEKTPPPPNIAKGLSPLDYLYDFFHPPLLLFTFQHVPSLFVRQYLPSRIHILSVCHMVYAIFKTRFLEGLQAYLNCFCVKKWVSIKFALFVQRLYVCIRTDDIIKLFFPKCRRVCAIRFFYCHTFSPTFYFNGVFWIWNS